uniref:Protein XRI1 n=1 Tax=Rhizophora mucronata TaxID=61149 RepID=A0A2P2KKQ3_RHIMU
MDSADNEEHSNLQSKDHCHHKESNCDVSQCLWNEVTLNEEDLSYMFDETTPVKACGDWAYPANHNDNTNKKPDRRKENFSQSKRRRMLQFDNQESDFPLCHEEMPSAFQNSIDGEDLTEDVVPQASQPVPSFPDVSVGSYEGLDQSPEKWLAECLNDTDMYFSSDFYMDGSGASGIQIDISEFCNDPPAFEANVVQKHVSRTSKNIIVKGGNSLLQTPPKLASSVVYPFAIIKPCEFHGDVTLNDINRQIQTPPPSKSKLNDEDPAAYPTSAFSGKPVVGKTKIRTEGKGSITIMRTKG